MENINTVTITGNLTADPTLTATKGGTSICNMRVAVNGRRKDQSGNWVDKPNYVDVTVFGGRGKSCAEHLAKGRPIAVSGRLDWSEWEDKETKAKRSKVGIIAETVQFLGTGNGSVAESGQQACPTGQPVAAGAQDDSDIPF